MDTTVGTTPPASLAERQPPCGTREGQGTWGACWAWIFAGALALQVVGIGWLPIMDRDEPRFAEASREMLRSGDFVVPQFNGVDRLDKPPLIYWLQAAAMRVFGGNEFAARLPSALAAAGIAALLYLMGRRAASPATGLRAATIFSTTLVVLVEGKLAVADMVMVFFVTAGFWAGWELARECEPGAVGSRRGWWWMYYISLALGFLAKGPVAWLPLLAPMWAARRTARAKQFRLVPGLAVMLALIGLWGVPALVRTHGEFLRQGIGYHVIERSLIPLEGHGSGSLAGYAALLPFYFLTVFVSFAPWSVFLPRAIRQMWRGTELPPLETYLALGVGVTFGIFTLVSTKLVHYTLPCFPLLALWLALRWPAVDDRGRWFARVAVGMALFALVAGAVGSWLARDFLIAGRLKPVVTRWAEPGTSAMTMDYDEPSLVWALRNRIDSVRDAKDPAELARFMAEPGRRLCVLPVSRLDEVFSAVPAAWRQEHVEGFSPAHGDHPKLVVLMKEQ